jgi:hypothetical protein
MDMCEFTWENTALRGFLSVRYLLDRPSRFLREPPIARAASGHVAPMARRPWTVVVSTWTVKGN